MNYAGANFDEQTRALLQPADYVNPTPQGRYHLVVVGAGPAGLISAIGAAGLGAKVALVERHRMGGDCLNVGCVPSKALLEYTAHHPDADFAGAFAWLREVRAGIAPHDSVERYTEAGVDVYLGAAAFDESGRVCVDGLSLDARRVVICTGARADIPPIPGLRESDPLTNETVFDLTAAPASLTILGAGAIGCELALAFARLGVGVDLFELADRVLPLEVRDASALVAHTLRAAGVKLHLGHAVSSVTQQQDGHRVEAGEATVVSEQVLVALGRRPNTEDLNLANARVRVSERGFILTDAKLRTTNKSIYAAGDCTAALQFTHHADAQARAVVQNALFAPTAKVDGLIVPHCTYTKPEVASVGDNEDTLTAAGVAYDVYQFDFAELDRGRVEIDGDGFARVYTTRGSDQILGATIVGHDAGEQIAPICMLMNNKLGLGNPGKTLFCYPTRSEYLKRLADAYTRSRFTPRVAGLFKRWLQFTG
jgi:pyruvate/2-oxoglutarate dehydrogenase complex dihydrolipoamide dehydrogenase (E3) component